MTQSMVMTRIGGVEYPMRSVPTCRTCQSPYRVEIENDLLRGYSYAAIARGIEGRAPGNLPHPSAESISAHLSNQHMPVQAAAQRRLIERRAEEIGRNIENEVEALADHVTLARMVVARGFERLQSGEIQPDLDEALAASRFLFQVEQQQDTSDLDQQALLQVLHAYMEITQQFVPPEQWEAYGRAVRSHPIIREMAERQEASRREQLEA